MKKVIALITLAALLVCSLAACGTKPSDDNTAGVTALDALSAIWNAHSEEQKFPAMGGDADHTADNAPGEFSIEDAAAVDSVLGLPEAEIGKVTGAVSLMHMMNANTFTAAAYDLADGTDAAALAEVIKTHLSQRQWMCGFPDKLVVLHVDHVLITAFGKEEQIDNFVTAAQTVYENITVLTDTSLMF